MKYFIVCGLLSLIPSLIPNWHPLLLAPLVVSTYQRTSLENALLVSLGVGILFDFVSADGHLGMYALPYTLTTLLLYLQKQAFYVTYLTTLPLLTLLFTSLTTLFYALALKLTGHSPPLWWGWLFTDLLAMPFLDGLYCLVGISLPLYLLFERQGKPAPYKMERPK